MKSESSNQKINDQNTNNKIDKFLENLFELPKFNVQKEFISNKINLFEENDLILLFNLVINKWSNIPLNRKDKFYYLLNCISEIIFIEPWNIKETEIRNYLIKIYLSNNSNNITFYEELINYIAICNSLSTLKLIKETIKSRNFSDEIKNYSFKIGQKKEIKKTNRDVLFDIYES